MKWLLKKLKQTCDFSWVKRSTVSNTRQEQELKVWKLWSLSISSSRLGGETGKWPIHSSKSINYNFAFTSMLHSSCFLPRSVTFLLLNQKHILHTVLYQTFLQYLTPPFLTLSPSLAFVILLFPIQYSLSLSFPSTFSAHPLNVGIP